MNVFSEKNICFLGFVSYKFTPWELKSTRSFVQAASLKGISLRCLEQFWHSLLAIDDMSRMYESNIGLFQERYNTPLEHTPDNPPRNYERNPFMARW